MALVVTLALAVSVTAVGQDDKKEADKANLKGVWVLKSGVASGKAAPQELIGKLTITFGPDNKFVMEGGKKKSEGTIQLDATKKPKEITITPSNRDEKPLLGIYKLEIKKDGDTLELCMGEPGQERPKDFASKKDENSFYLILQREQKKN